MSWFQDLAGFVKRLILLEQKVNGNAERLETLGKELSELRDFTRELSYVISRNQERTEDRTRNLTLSLENELLKLERRLNMSSPSMQPRQTDDEQTDEC